LPQQKYRHNEQLRYQNRPPLLAQESIQHHRRRHLCLLFLP
jgi:hypothetical protein